MMREVQKNGLHVIRISCPALLLLISMELNISIRVRSSNCHLMLYCLIFLNIIFTSPKVEVHEREATEVNKLCNVVET